MDVLPLPMKLLSHISPGWDKPMGKKAAVGGRGAGAESYLMLTKLADRLQGYRRRRVKTPTNVPQGTKAQRSQHSRETLRPSSPREMERRGGWAMRERREKKNFACSFHLHPLQKSESTKTHTLHLSHIFSGPTSATISDSWTRTDLRTPIAVIIHEIF